MQPGARRRLGLALSLLAAGGVTGCRAPAPTAACSPGAPPTCLAARVLATGYDGARTALADMGPYTPVVLGDAGALAAEWRRRRLRPPVPVVHFGQEVAVVYGIGRGSCSDYRTGLDSARRAPGDSVHLYLWEDHGGGCVDTTSFGVLAVAVQRPVPSSARPGVAVFLDDRTVERELERLRGPRRVGTAPRGSHRTDR